MNKAFLFFFIFFLTVDTYALQNGGSEYFSRSDWQLFYGTQQETLNKYKDGTKVTWKNTRNGHWGTITPIHSVTNNGTRCRDLIFFNSINEKTGHGTLTFCQIDGFWKVV